MLPSDGFLVRSIAAEYPGGWHIQPHTHPWAQLVYAARGVMTVEVESGSWVVPAHRAVWVPAHTEHQIDMTGTVAMRTLYISPDCTQTLPSSCETIEISPLLRELVLEIVRRGMLHRDVPEEARIAGVLVDLLGRIEVAPLRLPMPKHPRVRPILERLRRAPLEELSLEALAEEASMSVRSLERVFASETELTFVQWRLRMRLLHALRLLATDEPVTSVALAVGYQSPSAFIAAFKRELGVTPAEYHSTEAAREIIASDE